MQVLIDDAGELVDSIGCRKYYNDNTFFCIKPEPETDAKGVIYPFVCGGVRMRKTFKEVIVDV